MLISKFPTLTKSIYSPADRTSRCDARFSMLCAVQGSFSKEGQVYFSNVLPFALTWVAGVVFAVVVDVPLCAE